MNVGVCRAAAIGLTGMTGTVVYAEAAVSNQLPGMAIIGLPDAAVAEAKQRVRVATQQAGCSLSDRMIVVNLAPAAVPKQGSGFDLAIALAALAASGGFPASRLTEIAHLGELSLDGELCRPAGLLTAVLAAQQLGFTRAMVPACCAAEAALVPGIEIIAVGDLAGAVAWHRGDTTGWRIEQPSTAGTDSVSALCRSPETSASFDECDISAVLGQPEAVEALVIAAAGRHHLSMVGPPGAGKTLLATRLPSLLPDLTPEESTTVSSIASLGGTPLTELIRRPPFESPHHTASAVSIIGGGDAKGVRPGAVTRACHGVLFLDEAPEFPSAVLDALRQPLESGVVEIHRARVRASLPARIQLVLAANPCPCGNANTPDAAAPCRCSPHTRIRYLQRISGPLNDRIDVRLSVRRVSTVLQPPDEASASSQTLRSRIASARACAAERLRGTPWRVNAEVPGHWLRSTAMRLPRSDTAVLDQALSRGALTVRGYDRALRVAWSIADLAGSDRPRRAEVAQALLLRGGMTTL